jgi:hypothetical protein
MDTTTRRATVATIFVGSDVSKATLDVALRPSGEPWRRTHEEAGIAAGIGRRQPLAPHLIVLAATGGLERLAVAALALAGLPVVVVTPPLRCAIAPKRLDAWPRPMRWMRRRGPTSPRRSAHSGACCPTRRARRAPPWSSGAVRWSAC